MAFEDTSNILSLFGALNQAIGTYYDYNAQKSQFKSQASSLRHQQTLAEINARAAELDAQAILEAGETESMALTSAQGQRKATLRASRGASGVVMDGKGSAAEVEAGLDLIDQLDRFNLSGSIARQAAAARGGRVNALNQADILGASAANVLASGRSINPWVGVSTSLLSSAGTVAQEWRFAERRRSDRRGT